MKLSCDKMFNNCVVTLNWIETKVKWGQTSGRTTVETSECETTESQVQRLPATAAQCGSAGMK